MKRFIEFLVLGVAILFTCVNILIGCAADGSECDHCEKDSDCKDGLTCEIFDDAVFRCAPNSSTKCRSFKESSKESVTVKVAGEKIHESNNNSITSPN